MSFPRAKRFNYKDPDIDVSPADYYITSPGFKSITLPKCPRFVSRDDVSSFGNSGHATLGHKSSTNQKLKKEESKISRSFQIIPSTPHASSTPQKKKTFAFNVDKIKEKFICTSRDDISRFSFRKKSSNKSTQSDIICKSKNTSTKPQVLSSEDAYDDDYYSYTSSEELDSLRNVKTYSNKHRNSSRKAYFEEHILQQIQNINAEIKMLKQEIKTGNKQSKKLIRTDSLSSWYSDVSTSTDISDEIKYIIQRAVDNLRNEFERKYDMLQSDTISKIHNLAKDIYGRTQESKMNVEQLCRNTALHLAEEVIDFLLQKDKTLENEACRNYEYDDYSISNPEWGSFNYENICKILSDQLQISQRELEELKQEQNSVTNKYERSQETIQTQTSIIKQLHQNLSELKNSY